MSYLVGRIGVDVDPVLKVVAPILLEQAEIVVGGLRSVHQRIDRNSSVAQASVISAFELKSTSGYEH